MITRSNRELLNKGKGATGNEAPWRIDGSDLKPCDPSNSKIASSTAWLESSRDLVPQINPTTDQFFAYSGGDLIPKPI
jgi:hypothetical protein